MSLPRWGTIYMTAVGQPPQQRFTRSRQEAGQ